MVGVVRVPITKHGVVTVVCQSLMSSFLCSVQECSDFSITVVGHSLGAGVASVLALLLKTDNRLQEMHANAVKCYAYEPPGCVFRYVGGYGCVFICCSTRAPWTTLYTYAV